MATEKQLLGKILNFNEIDFNRSIHAYKQLIPIINDLAVDYERYGFGTFTQEAYNDILKNRANNIRQRYNEQVRKSIEDLKITSPTIRENMIKQASKDMDAYTEKISGWNGLFGIA